MKLVFVCCYCLFAVFIWRAITMRGRGGIGGAFAKRLQDFAHSDYVGHHHFAILFQWYFWAAIMLLFLMAVELVGVAYYFLENWLTEEIPVWLRRLTKGSIPVGIIAFAGIGLHFTIDTLRGKNKRREQEEEFPHHENLRHAWVPSERQDMMLIVIAVPAVFIIMSIRSSSRMWMVINHQYDDYGEATDKALYQENLDFAAVCQYIAVFQFSKLNYKFVVERASPETAHIIKAVGFIGVHAWVVVGSFISLFSFCTAYANAHYREVVLIEADTIQLVRSKLDDAFMAMTVLCVINMFRICQFEYVKLALGNANLKFLGTRALLLAAQIQPKVVQMPTVMRLLGLNRENAKLFHSTLLTIECFFVVAFNFFAWESRFGNVLKDSLYIVERIYCGRLPRKQKSSRALDDDEADCIRVIMESDNVGEWSINGQKAEIINIEWNHESRQVKLIGKTMKITGAEIDNGCFECHCEMLDKEPLLVGRQVSVESEGSFELKPEAFFTREKRSSVIAPLLGF